jgi:hypothetical protein
MVPLITTTRPWLRPAPGFLSTKTLESAVPGRHMASMDGTLAERLSTTAAIEYMYQKHAPSALPKPSNIFSAPLCRAQDLVGGRRHESGIGSGTRPAAPRPGHNLRQARPVPTCGHPNIGRHFQPLNGPSRISKGAHIPVDTKDRSYPAFEGG